MIIIKNKGASTQIYPPKHWYAGSALTFTLISALRNEEYTFDVTDESGLTDFFLFNIDTSAIEDGEYKYQVKEDTEIVSSGLLRVGEYKADKTEYNYTQEYIEYQND